MTRGDLIDALCKVSAEPSQNDLSMLQTLQVEHAELVGQVENLRNDKVRLEGALAHFSDLFDMAPAAYCVVDRHGVIKDANLALATLLCVNRTQLVGAQLVSAAGITNEEAFLALLERCSSERIRVSADFTCIVRGRGEVAVKAVSTPQPDACRVVLHDVTRMKQELDAMRFLAGLHDAFGEALEVDATAEAVARACVPRLGDAVFVDICDEHGAFARRAGLAVSPQCLEAREPILANARDAAWQRYAERIVETEEPVFEPSSAAAFSATLHASAFLLLPLVGRNERVGVLGALRMRDTYALEDLELARVVARRAAHALENAFAFTSSR